MAPLRRSLVAVLMPSETLDAVIAPDELARLRSAADVIVATELSELLHHPEVARIVAVVTGWGTPLLDASALALLPGVQLIAHAAGTVRHLVGREPWDLGVTVTSAADVNAEPVADFCLAYVVLALKGLGRGDVRRGPGRAAARGIYDADVGLVSFGAVASRLAVRLRGLDARVRVWDPVIDPEELSRAGVLHEPDLGALFERSAVVSVHTPLIPGVTERTVRGEHLDRLPCFATLINTSRGPIIDEPAMVQVLTRRPDLTAVLDVTDHEPLAQDDPLQHLSNVVLTGHTAGSVGSECFRLGASAVDRVLEWLRNGSVAQSVGRGEAAVRA